MGSFTSLYSYNDVLISGSIYPHRVSNGLQALINMHKDIGSQFRLENAYFWCGRSSSQSHTFVKSNTQKYGPEIVDPHSTERAGERPVRPDLRLKAQCGLNGANLGDSPDSHALRYAPVSIQNKAKQKQDESKLAIGPMLFESVHDLQEYRSSPPSVDVRFHFNALNWKRAKETKFSDWSIEIREMRSRIQIGTVNEKSTRSQQGFWQSLRRFVTLTESGSRYCVSGTDDKWLQVAAANRSGPQASPQEKSF